MQISDLIMDCDIVGLFPCLLCTEIELHFLFFSFPKCLLPWDTPETCVAYLYRSFLNDNSSLSDTFFGKKKKTF